jgi:nucleoside-diphosphate-sugar epimerase
LGSVSVLWAANQAGVKRVVLASSAAVYGEAESVVEENSPQHPLSPYASSKHAMEQAAVLFTRAYDLPTVALRFFNVYGPRQAPDSPYAAAIPMFIQTMMTGKPPRIHGDGQQSRDFIFVEDAVRAMQLAAAYEQAAGEVFNVGGGSSITILELVRTLQPLFPQAPPPVHVDPRPGDIRFSEANIDRIRAALKYRPEIDLQKGLEITVQWFLAREKKSNE